MIVRGADDHLPRYCLFLLISSRRSGKITKTAKKKEWPKPFLFLVVFLFYCPCSRLRHLSRRPGFRRSRFNGASSGSLGPFGNAAMLFRSFLNGWDSRPWNSHFFPGLCLPGRHNHFSRFGLRLWLPGNISRDACPFFTGFNGSLRRGCFAYILVTVWISLPELYLVQLLIRMNTVIPGPVCFELTEFPETLS